MSKGLRGIEAGTTSICTVGETGDDLNYRGYDVVDLSDIAFLRKCVTYFFMVTFLIKTSLKALQII